MTGDYAGLEVVDRRRQPCDREPAAGATMTSSMTSSRDHSEEDACAAGCGDNKHKQADRASAAGAAGQCTFCKASSAVLLV